MGNGFYHYWRMDETYAIGSDDLKPYTPWNELCEDVVDTLSYQSILWMRAVLLAETPED